MLSLVSFMSIGGTPYLTHIFRMTTALAAATVVISPNGPNLANGRIGVFLTRAVNLKVFICYKPFPVVRRG